MADDSGAGERQGRPRLFWAAEVGAAAQRELVRLQEQLRAAAPEARIRWVRPDQAGFHLTLQFLGASPSVAEVAAAGAEISSCFSLTTRLDALGAFGGRRPSILWCGLDAKGLTGLRDLAAATARAMAPLGFEPDPRGYTPHITLGRAARHAGVRGGAAALDRLGAALASIAVEPAELRIEEAVLFESVQAEGGPRYEPRARVRLRAP